MSDTKGDRIAEARKQLALANRQWDEASTAAWEPAEPAECVSKCFYAFENAVVAAAMALTARGRSLFAEPACSGSLAMSD